MILHVIPKSASAPGRPSSRFTMKGSVYDKIRADFNSSKKDRFIYVERLTNVDVPSSVPVIVNPRNWKCGRTFSVKSKKAS